MGLWAKRVFAALAALTLTVLPAVAQVPDPFARELAQRLARMNTLMEERDYAQAAGPLWGGMGENERRRFPIMLRAGQDYRIVGVCESHCRNLDLRLFGPSNQLIAQDNLNDAVPVIHIVPVATGQYSIEAAMVGCNTAQCWYAFNVYSR